MGFSVASALEVVGGLSKPSKMPGFAYGIPAQLCKVGSELRKIKGSVCEKCYAQKGAYSWGPVKKAYQRRFDTLNHPQWMEAMVFLMKKKKIEWFRWHDSGDLQSVEHLNKICLIALETPETNYWLPTKEKAIVKQYRKQNEIPKNLVIRVSGAMIDGERPAGFENTSTVSSDKNSATCVAYLQGGKCLDCRACWNPEVKNIVYPKH